MDKAKFQEEVAHLSRFFSFYCHDNHTCQEMRLFTLEYSEKKYEQKLVLCAKCTLLLGYAHRRLQSCPHDPKPRCRKCQTPCYEKKEWKALAKVMRYGAIRSQVTKWSDFLFKPFSLR